MVIFSVEKSFAACCVGMGRATLEEVIAHVTTRYQFGQPVSQFQAVQHQVADMAARLEAMALLTYSAAAKMTQGIPAIKEISMAKAFAAEGINDIITYGMRLLGAKAYLQETPMMRLLWVVGFVLMLCSGIANAWKDTGQRPAPLVCGPGQAACRGPYGQSCYLPSAGEHCTLGIVCGPGRSVCIGRFGQSCYQPSAGERCTQGLVCGPGYSVCAVGARARCYRPSAGETCG